MRRCRMTGPSASPTSWNRPRRLRTSATRRSTWPARPSSRPSPTRSTGANFRSCSAAMARASQCRPQTSRAREALAATAAWVREDLDLVMRVALVPVKDIRTQGLDIRVARFGPSANLSYAMFSGGGLGWADAAMKRGEFAVPAAAPGTQPDLSGLSCRFEEIPSTRGLILSVLVVPARGADPHRFRKVIEDIIRLVEQSPDAGRPVPPGGPP